MKVKVYIMKVWVWLTERGCVAYSWGCLTIGRTRPLATAPGTCCLGYLHFSCRTDHTPILTLRSMHVSLIALMLNKKTFQGQTFKLCEPLAWGPEAWRSG